MKEFLKSSRGFIIIALIGLAVMIGGIVYRDSQINSGYDVLKSHQLRVSEMKNELELAKGAKERRESSVIYDTGGVDLNRTVRDDEAITTKVSRLLTWKDGKEYDEVRNEFIEWLGPDDQVVVEFMDYNPWTDGHSYIDDKGLNSKFSSIVTYVLGVDGDIYNCMAVARAVTVVGESNIEGDMNFIFTYKTDKDGNITDFKVQNLANNQENSGWFK